LSEAVILHDNHLMQFVVKKSLKSGYPRPWAGHYARFMASPPRFLMNYKQTHSSPTKGRGILRQLINCNLIPAQMSVGGYVKLQNI